VVEYVQYKRNSSNTPYSKAPTCQIGVLLTFLDSIFSTKSSKSPLLWSPYFLLTYRSHASAPTYPPRRPASLPSPSFARPRSPSHHTILELTRAAHRLTRQFVAGHPDPAGRRLRGAPRPPVECRGACAGCTNRAPAGLGLVARCGGGRCSSSAGAGNGGNDVGELHLHPGAPRDEIELRPSRHGCGTARARSGWPGTGAALHGQDPVGRAQARHKLDLRPRGGDGMEGARPPGDELLTDVSNPRESSGRALGRRRAPSRQRILRRRAAFPRRWNPKLQWLPWEGRTRKEGAPLGGTRVEAANHRVGAPFSTRGRRGRRGNWGGREQCWVVE
jgi:hypothetical protein